MTNLVRTMVTLSDFDRTFDELKQNGYRYHHTGSRRGYVSRRTCGNVEDYEGRFGKGVVLVLPRHDTTQYVDLMYWIKEA
jgi:hypothetical protein